MSRMSDLDVRRSEAGFAAFQLGWADARYACPHRSPVEVWIALEDSGHEFTEHERALIPDVVESYRAAYRVPQDRVPTWDAWVRDFDDL